MENVKDEIEELEEMEDETVEEETQEAASNSNSNQKSYKDQVIEFVKGLISKYKDQKIKENDDPYFLANLDNNKKSEDECVNYVMNDLTSKRMMMGDDSIIYGLIHDYYVDSVEAGDNWSQYLNRSNAPSAPKKEVKLTEEAKKKLQEKAEAEFIEEQKRKLEEIEKKRLEKEKEKERIRKEKEAEAKRLAAEKKAQEEANKPKQMSLFDFE